jgi:hypothetical protein
MRRGGARRDLDSRKDAVGTAVIATLPTFEV